MTTPDEIHEAMEVERLCAVFAKSMRHVVDHARTIPGEVSPRFSTLISELQVALDKYDRVLARKDKP